MGCCRKRTLRGKLKIALLMVGEGPTDRYFLQHLKSLFWRRSCDHSVIVNNAHGGSPEDIIRQANDLLFDGAYSRCAVVLDDDIPPKPNTFQKIVKKHPKIEISIIQSTPCIEGLMLEILEGKHPRTSKQCKSLFRRKYISDHHFSNSQQHEKLFPKELIEEAALRIKPLDQMIRFLKNEPIEDAPES